MAKCPNCGSRTIPPYRMRFGVVRRMACAFRVADKNPFLELAGRTNRREADREAGRE